MKVKELIEMLEKENPEYDVYLGEFNDHYNLNHHLLDKAANAEYQELNKMVLFNKGVVAPIETKKLSDK
jgi:hypothetical protein